MEDLKTAIQGCKPTLVDFFATWCGHCRAQSPIIDDVKTRVGDKANVFKVDIEEHKDMANEYNIQSVPTLILFKDGKALWRASGVQQADELIAKINEHTSAKKCCKKAH